MMSQFAFALLGRLGWNQFPQDAITRGGAAAIVCGVLFICALITYLHRWKWLWKEWMTTQDPKRIGVMYIIVALVMLLRGAGDAALVRTQQAVAAGNGGILDSNHFQQIVSAHGTIMIFFVAMGLMFGLINLGAAIAARRPRRCLPIFERYELLAVFCRYGARQSVAGRWRFFGRWLAGLSAAFRTEIQPDRRRGLLDMVAADCRHWQLAVGC